MNLFFIVENKSEVGAQVFIFTFTGSSNQNYMWYMLDLYALLEFECSPELKEALLNDWPINLCRELSKFLEGNLMQVRDSIL
jgi:hypothetical protein